jgi:chorismate synthase
MNHIGRLFQINIYGESHGGGVGILLDGVTPGIPLTEEDFLLELSRRKAGGLGTTPRIKADEVHIISGVFNGYTTGAPILLSFVNSNTKSKDYSNLIDQPRPSHADYTAHIKYDGYNDYRGGGHFSGRLTLGVVSAGVVAKKMLKGVTFHTSLTNLNGCEDQSKFQSILKEAVDNKDSVGGIVTLTATGLPVGLGEPYFDSLESTIAHLMFSVGGVKGIEFGIGFDGVGLKGSEFNDKIIDSKGTTLSNNNGGINGGISNGNPIVVKVSVKPTPSIGLKQETYNFRDDKVKSLEIEGRHDAAIIQRAMVVLEACLAIALCDANLIRNAYKK